MGLDRKTAYIDAHGKDAYLALPDWNVRFRGGYVG